MLTFRCCARTRTPFPQCLGNYLSSSICTHLLGCFRSQNKAKNNKIKQNSSCFHQLFLTPTFPPCSVVVCMQNCSHGSNLKNTNLVCRKRQVSNVLSRVLYIPTRKGANSQTDIVKPEAGSQVGFRVSQVNALERVV